MATKTSLIKLTKDAPTMQEVMQKAKNTNLNLALYEIPEGIKIKIIEPKKDYAIIRREVSALLNKEAMYIYPYGGKIGYVIKD